MAQVKDCHILCWHVLTKEEDAPAPYPCLLNTFETN